MRRKKLAGSGYEVVFHPNHRLVSWLRNHSTVSLIVPLGDLVFSINHSTVSLTVPLGDFVSSNLIDGAPGYKRKQWSGREVPLSGHLKTPVFGVRVTYLYLYL